MVATEYTLENHQFKLAKIVPMYPVKENRIPFERNS